MRRSCIRIILVVYLHKLTYYTGGRSLCYRPRWLDIVALYMAYTDVYTKLHMYRYTWAYRRACYVLMDMSTVSRLMVSPLHVITQHTLSDGVRLSVNADFAGRRWLSCLSLSSMLQLHNNWGLYTSAGALNSAGGSVCQRQGGGPVHGCARPRLRKRVHRQAGWRQINVLYYGILILYLFSAQWIFLFVSRLS